MQNIWNAKDWDTLECQKNVNKFKARETESVLFHSKKSQKVSHTMVVNPQIFSRIYMTSLSIQKCKWQNAAGSIQILNIAHSACREPVLQFNERLSSSGRPWVPNVSLNRQRHKLWQKNWNTRCFAQIHSVHTIYPLFPLVITLNGSSYAPLFLARYHML